MITKKMKKVIESCDWNIYEYENGIELSKYSNAGEDFSMNISAINDEKFLEDLQNYYKNFNTDDHAAMWYGTNKGEPNSLRVLLDDAKDIENNIEELLITCSNGGKIEHKSIANRRQHERNRSLFKLL